MSKILNNYKITFSLNLFEIFVIFLIFRLTDVISWSWWYVSLPLIIKVVGDVILLIISLWIDSKKDPLSDFYKQQTNKE